MPKRIQDISITGARTHNLKNFDITLPHNQLIVITGLSGSGKSSLAFDTIYAEGQRRYVASLSTYARQFLSVMDKPDIDQITGLSPAIAIEQKMTSHNPRSTVGTTTEIYDYLRLLFARIGTPHCPQHQTPLNAQSISSIIEHTLGQFDQQKIMILAPMGQKDKSQLRVLFDDMTRKGFTSFLIDQKPVTAAILSELDSDTAYEVKIVIDRLTVSAEVKDRLADSLDMATKLSQGLVFLQDYEQQQKGSLYSTQFNCTLCDFTPPELEPKLFSFNSPSGACQRCNGLGRTDFFDPKKIVTNPSNSIADGAIQGWDKTHAFYFNLLGQVASYYNFSLDTPYCDLPKTTQDIILYGSQEKIKFIYAHSRYKTRSRSKAFEGIIPMLERRYKETESNAMRQSMARFLTDSMCPECKGSRLNQAASNVKINQFNIHTITSLPLDLLIKEIKQLKLSGQKATIAASILKEVISRLTFLINVGLNYLTLNRSAESLSGGEAQRIRLASQIGSGLVGVIYVLDEPSIGLHSRDNARLIETLRTLQSIGNTVIVVEHDEDTMLSADQVIDIGPGAGVHGGEVIFQGTPQSILTDKKSLTGQYLSGKKCIAVPKTRKAFCADQCISIKGAYANNLQKIDVTIPVGLMTCVTGVSGSGKSTLINDTLYPYLRHHLNKDHPLEVSHCDAIEGLEHIDRIIRIDQNPIGRTPRSNPATYVGLFTPIRDLFVQMNEAKARGYKPGRFSFNVRGGRCEACEGDGMICVSMHFLSDVYVLCDQCNGQRYNEQTLQVKFKGKHIADVLNMTADEALGFFKSIPTIFSKCQTLVDVGLGYIKLGQSATTLSGGEAQRIKLAKELTKRNSGHTLYLLDEPTTGLHTHDIQSLLNILQRLKNQGNTIIIIEHNLDVIKTADWIIDLGPEGGEKGGKLVFAGSPEALCKQKKSYTGQFLAHKIQTK